MSYPQEFINELDEEENKLRKQIRQLQRALWLARAERAKEFRYKIGFAISSMNTKYNYSDADKWQNVERKCRAKAEDA